MKIRTPFFNTDSKSKLVNDQKVMLQKSLQSYAAEEVKLNDEILPSKAIVRERYDSNGESMKIQMESGLLKRGTLVNYKDENWLIVTKPEDDGVYSKAYMTHCTGSFPFLLPPTKELLVDEFGKPILNIYGDEQYKTIPGGNIYVPCIVETSYYNKETNVQLPIADGTILLTMQYDAAHKIKVNYQFEMYNNKYKVNTIDYSKVSNEQGLIKLICKVVV